MKNPFHNRKSDTNNSFDDNIDMALANAYAANDTDTMRENVNIVKTLVDAKKEFNDNSVQIGLKVATLSASIVSIIMMFAFESDNVITTKALSFIPKAKD